VTLDELRETVRVCRELGVTELDGLKLGPPPPPPAEPDPEPPTEDQRVRGSLERMLRSAGLVPSEGFIERWKRAHSGATEDVADA
jgi:hypothetical protein